MRISDWSSDVCSSDLLLPRAAETARFARQARDGAVARTAVRVDEQEFRKRDGVFQDPNKPRGRAGQPDADIAAGVMPLFRISGPALPSPPEARSAIRSAEHTSERQSLMRI